MVVQQHYVSDMKNHFSLDYRLLMILKLHCFNGFLYVCDVKVRKLYWTTVCKQCEKLCSFIALLHGSDTKKLGGFNSYYWLN